MAKRKGSPPKAKQAKKKTAKKQVGKKKTAKKKVVKQAAGKPKRAASARTANKSAAKKPTKKKVRSGAAAETSPQWRARAHRTAVEFDWGYGCAKLHEIIRQQCDLGTALEIYWSGRPDFYRQYKTRDEVNQSRDVFDMLVEIERNVLSGFYRHQNIAYDPFNDHGQDMTNVYPELASKYQCELPAEMYQPVGDAPPRKPRRARRKLPVGLSTIAEAGQPTEALDPRAQAIRQLSDAGDGDICRPHVEMDGDQVLHVNYSGDEKVRDDDLQHIKFLPELKRLTIGQEMTDAAFGYLQFVPNLERFRIGGRGHKITGAGLAHLRHVPHLKRLDIGGYMAKINDAALANLRHVPELVRLDLSGLRQMTDAGLVHLAHLKQLKILNLASTKVGNAGLAHLAPLVQLEELDLHWYTKITNPGLAHLAPLKNLQRLDLVQTKITDPGLPHLESLRQLQELDLRSTKVTSQGVDQLRKALPKCNIMTGEY